MVIVTMILQIAADLWVLSAEPLLTMAVCLPILVMENCPDIDWGLSRTPLTGGK